MGAVAIAVAVAPKTVALLARLKNVQFRIAHQRGTDVLRTPVAVERGAILLVRKSSEAL